MSQKIKKQIKGSMPWLMIISLIISSTIAGLVFNLDFNINNLFNKEDVFVLPQAQADTATTTVTVRNAPPSFTVSPVEDPVSASTTPRNVGGTISFKATASDPENNSYYLIVCDQAGVTASTTGGPPTCNNTTFCVSSLTADDAEATCVYSSISDPGAESQDWYSYVCDNHPTQAACSDTYDQGSGDSGSPFYVNHAPSYTAVATTDDNKDPGENFTVTATVTDSDVVGGADVLYLYVCDTDSWATSTGCGGSTWCTGTSTSPNISCQFASSSPAVDGTYDPGYYAFVMDWHGFAGNSGNSRSAAYTINNVAPTVSNVVINGGENITPSIKNATEYVASSSATISDNNSCTDIQSATSTIYISDVAGGQYCSSDDNYCYRIISTYCQAVAGSCTGSSDTSMDYVCSTTIAYHAYPTDNSTNNPKSGENWLAGLTAFDESLSGNATSSIGVELISVEAIDVTETGIAYGIIRGGDNSGNSNATTTVINYGNTPINSGIQGTDMDKSDHTDLIPADNQKYATSSVTYASLDYTLASTSTYTLDTETTRPTSSADVSDEVYWGIQIPAGTTSGDYSGVNTFTAILDSNDW